MLIFSHKLGNSPIPSDIGKNAPRQPRPGRTALTAALVAARSCSVLAGPAMAVKYGSRIWAGSQAVWRRLAGCGERSVVRAYADDE